MEREIPVLASASPRRRELLRLLYPEFEVYAPQADETIPPGLPVEQAPELLACRKALAAAEKFGSRLIVAADTLVAVQGCALGKPESRAAAAQMLRQLSGRVHQVYTGVCLRRGDEMVSFTQCTQVEFYPLSEEEIERYLDTGEPMDKAGAYGIQGKGSLLVKAISGDYFNVVGLPLARLARALREMENRA
ncbi:MAG: Maf family protein [Oscillospiraceae bacterium]|nr:Maf family protein [Oscillospiraceae bacterium]